MYRGANSTAMYSTYFENGGWSGPQQIHNNLTSEGVGLAVYDNRMYCAYRHSDGKSGQIYWMSSTDGTWPQAQPLHGHACDYEPSLITYNGELHLVYQGQDKKIWHVRYNGDWHSAQPLGTQRAIDGLSSPSSTTVSTASTPAGPSTCFTPPGTAPAAGRPARRSVTAAPRGRASSGTARRTPPTTS
ncbi:hypothetical protein GCM10020254_87930 [Streptomyces goshikiensis]